ncbi:hypothetical protein SD81_021555 [Tolypothrix campylonemoides VB511288]|nr:hypothetical protein SD81_021555 [Tolypothrix campylonemoides VB511288]
MTEVAGTNVRCQDSISLPSKTELEPDFSIVKKRADNYLSGHSKPSDILLVIEIANSSLQLTKKINYPSMPQQKFAIIGYSI